MQIGDQIPTRFQFGMQGADVNTRLFKMKVGDISPPMLIEIMKVMFRIDSQQKFR